jgi:hypothetical protein
MDLRDTGNQQPNQQKSSHPGILVCSGKMQPRKREVTKNTRTSRSPKNQ